MRETVYSLRGGRCRVYVYRYTCRGELYGQDEPVIGHAYHIEGPKLHAGSLWSSDVSAEQALGMAQKRFAEYHPKTTLRFA